MLGQRMGEFRWVAGGKRRRVGELSIVISIVQLEIKTSEADTYVKVGGLPGWRRRRRKRERPGSSSDTTEHIMEQTAQDSKYQTVINQEQERRAKVDV